MHMHKKAPLRRVVSGKFIVINSPAENSPRIKKFTVMKIIRLG